MNKRLMTLSLFVAFLAFTLIFIFSDTREYSPKKQKDKESTASLSFWRGDTLPHIHGIDVSHFQDSVDWQKVKDFGVTFVFVKATEGVDYLDTLFHYNWENVAKQNMIRGAYHFYESDDDPVKQAEWFIGNVKSFKSTLPPVIDVERAGHKGVPLHEYQTKLTILLKEVEKLSGRKPIIYSSPAFAASHLDDPLFGDYMLWVADYDVDSPQIPQPWQNTGWNFWQNSQQAEVPGVPKRVDRNRYAGKFVDLIRMVKE